MYSETFDIMHWIFGTKAAGGRELAPRSPSRTMTLWMEDDTEDQGLGDNGWRGRSGHSILIPVVTRLDNASLVNF